MRFSAGAMLFYDDCNCSMDDIRKITLACVLVAVVWFSAGADDYVQRQSEKGWVFHMFCKKMPSAVSKQKPGAVEYDYTYVEGPDSVSLLMTIELPAAYKPVRAEFRACGAVDAYESGLIYADSKGKGYKCRIKTSFPFDDWVRMYSCSDPFRLSLVFDGGSGYVSYVFGFAGRQWEKHRSEVSRFQQTIKYNTGK